MPVRKFLYVNGYRYKLRDKSLPGEPDKITILLSRSIYRLLPRAGKEKSRNFGRAIGFSLIFLAHPDPSGVLLYQDKRKSNTYLCPMADVHSKETRSYNMSQIKGKNTKPEMLVRKFLHDHGYRYKLHDNNQLVRYNILL